MRLILTYGAIFLVPGLGFWLYVQLLRWQNGARDLPSTPWVWLAIAGLALLIASFVALGLPQANAPDKVYVPAHMENGALVPAETRPK
jgi:hypothetical protein